MVQVGLILFLYRIFTLFPRGKKGQTLDLAGFQPGLLTLKASSHSSLVQSTDKVSVHYTIFKTWTLYNAVKTMLATIGQTQEAYVMSNSIISVL